MEDRKPNATCLVCNAQMHSIGIPGAEERFCETCSRLPRCSKCRFPILDMQQDQIIERDFFACRHCMSALILRQEQLDELAGLAFESLDQVLGMQIRGLRSLRLGARNSVIRAGRAGAVEVGVNPDSVVGVAYRGRVLVCRGHSKAASLWFLAHELAHIWQNNNEWMTGDRYRMIREGFCEWVALRVSEHRQLYQETAERLEYTDPVYGAGLRYFLELERMTTTKLIIKGHVVHEGLLAKMGRVVKRPRAKQRMLPR